jgi:YesN/AraC family two-component response regulator
MYKIIIVEDNSMFRKSIGTMLEKEEIAKVIAEATNGQEFLDIIDKHEPD